MSAGGREYCSGNGTAGFIGPGWVGGRGGGSL